MDNPLGHPDECTCEQCQDWKDGLLGIGLLKVLKASKAAQTDLPHCANCGRAMPADAVFCPWCGKKI